MEADSLQLLFIRHVYIDYENVDVIQVLFSVCCIGGRSCVFIA